MKTRNSSAHEEVQQECDFHGWTSQHFLNLLMEVKVNDAAPAGQYVGAEGRYLGLRWNIIISWLAASRQRCKYDLMTHSSSTVSLVKSTLLTLIHRKSQGFIAFCESNNASSHDVVAVSTSNQRISWRILWYFISLYGWGPFDEVLS